MCWSIRPPVLPVMGYPVSLRTMAIDPDLVWQDLGLAPRYAAIYDGIPAVVASQRETDLLTTQLR